MTGPVVVVVVVLVVRVQISQYWRIPVAVGGGVGRLITTTPGGIVVVGGTIQRCVC